MYSGITSILEVNLFAFAYRLIVNHETIASIFKLIKDNQITET